MKKQLCIFLFACTATCLQAQSSKYMDAMQKALIHFDSSKTAEEFLNTANSFERIGLVEMDQWLPDYYCAVCHVTAAFLNQDVSKMDTQMDIAQKFADRADSLSPDNSEIYVLKSMILDGRIMVDPQTRGQQYGMQSLMAINRATQLNPDNPRAYLLLGQSLLYTPPQFGGGKDKGCAMLQTAKEKFDSFRPASPIDPNWGGDQVVKLLEQCSQDDHNDSGNGNN